MSRDTVTVSGMLQGKAISEVLMQTVDSVHCATLVNGEKGEPLSVAMTSNPAPGSPTGNQCRSIGAIAARAWSQSAKMARARKAAAIAADPNLSATLGDKPEGQKELLIELEEGRVLVTHVCGNLLIVIIAVLPKSEEQSDSVLTSTTSSQMVMDDFGMLRKKAAAAKKLLEPPLREWVAERERLSRETLAPQQDAAETAGYPQ